MLDIYRTSTENSALFGKEWSPLNGGAQKGYACPSTNGKEKLGIFLLLLLLNTIALVFTWKFKYWFTGSGEENENAKQFI